MIIVFAITLLIITIISIAGLFPFMVYFTFLIAKGPQHPIVQANTVWAIVYLICVSVWISMVFSL